MCTNNVYMCSHSLCAYYFFSQENPCHNAQFNYFHAIITDKNWNVTYKIELILYFRGHVRTMRSDSESVEHVWLIVLFVIQLRSWWW